MIDKIHCMDCLEGMKLLPDNSVDLVVTSPPYNIGIDYDNYNDNIETNKYLENINNCAKELYRILKEDGRVVINIAHILNNNFDFDLPYHIKKIFLDNNFKWKVDIVWNKKDNHGTAWGSWKSASSPSFICSCELIIVFYKNQWKKLNKGDNTINTNEFIFGVNTVWNFPSSKNKYHPATFPIKLIRRLIELLSFKNDIVLDPYNGIGTTCIAAKQCGRKYIGFDLSPIYCQMAKNNLRQEVLF